MYQQQRKKVEAGGGEHLSSLVDGSHSSGGGDFGVALGNNDTLTLLSLSFTTNFIV